MPDYEIVLLPQAEADIASWPPPLQQYIESQLLLLAADPVSLGRRTAFPYPPRCQLFQPGPIVHNGERHEFTILFRFGQDENTLQIVGIGHIVR